MMNKRVLRKFAIPSSRPNPKNGIFCADQVKYVVRTAIKNIDHQRTLVLYIYAKESVLAGNHNPRWTMFQQKGGYITLRSVGSRSNHAFTLVTSRSGCSVSIFP